ncbi:MAG: prephenate dehydratase [Nitrospirae bacterium]|nr:prephenate dehydratase [Nitrospirota bacterium]
MSELDDLRNRIDELDARVLALLNERAKIAVRIGEVKRETGAEAYAPVRENEVFGRLDRSNAGPFPAAGLRAVFREIVSACRSLERPLRVAYLGPEATFTHLACLRRFGSSVEAVPVETIPGVFKEVERGGMEFGVVPVENSTEGVINYTVDSLIESDLKITSEILLDVSQHLLSAERDLSRVKKVYSHPQAVAQCRGWLDKNMPRALIVEVSSTAKAAEMASKDPEAAAIASEAAAGLYRLEIVEPKIEDRPNNQTRFLVIGKKDTPRTGRDKTSLVFSIKDRPGALYKMLEPFAHRGINLTRLDARPSKQRTWEYLFFMDLAGHVEDSAVKEAIASLEAGCLFLKVLGSYPADL